MTLEQSIASRYLDGNGLQSREKSVRMENL